MRDMNAENRKPMEAWQIEDAARLERIYRERWVKPDGKKRSMKEFGELFDLGTPAYVGNMLNGVRALNYETARKFAQGLQCSIAEFSPRLARQLAPFIDDNGVGNVIPAPELRGKVPVISWVQAGNWMDAIDNFAPGDAEEWISTTYAAKQNTFALRVTGDSMEPVFPAGCLIIVEPDCDPVHGSYVVAKRPGDGLATFKQLVFDGSQIYLKPLNNKYPLLDFPPDAKVVGVVKRMEMEF